MLFSSRVMVRFRFRIRISFSGLLRWGWSGARKGWLIVRPEIACGAYVCVVS